jgi:hypothetical protein
MPRHNFDDKLRLVAPPAAAGAGAAAQLAPLAKGPVGDGEELAWVAVWIYQNYGNGKAAIAAGASRYDATRQAERPPFQGTWTVRTQLTRNSDPFKPGRPALATAIAAVNLPDGAKEAYWWSEAVSIAAPRKS